MFVSSTGGSAVDPTAGPLSLGTRSALTRQLSGTGPLQESRFANGKKIKNTTSSSVSQEVISTTTDFAGKHRGGWKRRRRCCFTALCRSELTGPTIQRLVGPLENVAHGAHVAPTSRPPAANDGSIDIATATGCPVGGRCDRHVGSFAVARAERLTLRVVRPPAQQLEVVNA